MKKILALLLVAVMVLGLAACGKKENKQSSEEPKTEATEKKMYYDNDVSEHQNLVLYYIGGTYGDEDLIFARVNEIMEEKINAHIDFKRMDNSEHATKYSLLLAGDEQIDLIYTAGWAHYIEESAKGAFMEITEDLLKKYAPVTFQTQDRASFEYGMIDGHLYYLPCNKVGYGHICVGIRGDLREKYNLPEIKTVDDLLNYMTKVQEDKDNGIQYAYAASLNGSSLQTMLMTDYNNLVSVADGFYYEYKEKPSADELFWLYDTPEYLEYAKKVAGWAKQGFWSTNAVNNQTDTKDAFLAGTSAMYLSNLGTVGNVMNSVLQANPEWKPEMYDIDMDKCCFGAFDQDGYAIPYRSKLAPRALMALDVMKNDPDCYYTIRYGNIKAGQVILNDDGTWSQGTNYGDGHWSYGAAPSWGLKNTNLERDQDTTFPKQIEIFAEWKKIAITKPTVAFAFSTDAVADAWANLNQVYTKYVPTLQLGLAEDVEGWIASFKQEAEAAGLAEIQAEIQKQLKAYLESH